MSPSESAGSGGFAFAAVDRAAYAGIANNGVEVTLDNVCAKEGAAQPEMTIDPAVILTWPIWTAGFTLESAGSVDGPWSALEVSPSLTPEGSVVSVKTTTATRYFRLVRP